MTRAQVEAVLRKHLLTPYDPRPVNCTERKPRIYHERDWVRLLDDLLALDVPPSLDQGKPEQLLAAEETADMHPPFRALPVGHPDWITKKQRRLATALQEIERETEQRTERKVWEAAAEIAEGFDVTGSSVVGLTALQIANILRHRAASVGR